MKCFIKYNIWKCSSKRFEAHTYLVANFCLNVMGVFIIISREIYASSSYSLKAISGDVISSRIPTGDAVSCIVYTIASALGLYQRLYHTIKNFITMPSHSCVSGGLITQEYFFRFSSIVTESLKVPRIKELLTQQFFLTGQACLCDPDRASHQ